MTFFTELEYIVLKFVCKHKRLHIDKTILRKKNKAGVIMLPDFKLNYQTIVVLAKKQTHRSMEQNRQPRNEPTLYGQLICDKEGKDIQQGKDSLFSKWCWENWTATCKRTKLDYPLTPCKIISAKWMKDLNIRPETIEERKER